jgi:hypothetical protein
VTTKDISLEMFTAGKMSKEKELTGQKENVLGAVRNVWEESIPAGTSEGYECDC